MAKTKTRPGLTEQAPALPETTLETVAGCHVTCDADAPTVMVPAPKPAPRYRVELHCPTPLAHKVMELEAADEREAQALYEAANGICGSSHPFTVTRL